MIKIDENSIIKPLPTDEEYSEEAKLWGVNTPYTFKKFIQKYNCAKPIDFEIKANRTRLVTRFFGIVNDAVADFINSEYDISHVQSEAFQFFYYGEDRYDNDLMPFAELFGGDFLCLDKGKNNEYEDNPRVCVLSHEESGEFDPVTYHVADSFDEFVVKYHIL